MFCKVTNQILQKLAIGTTSLRSIVTWVNPNASKIAFHSCLTNVQYKNDLKFLSYFLAKATL